MDKKTQFNIWYFVAALIDLFPLQTLFTQMANVEVEVGDPSSGSACTSTG